MKTIDRKENNIPRISSPKIQSNNQPIIQRSRFPYWSQYSFGGGGRCIIGKMLPTLLISAIGSRTYGEIEIHDCDLEQAIEESYGHAYVGLELGLESFRIRGRIRLPVRTEDERRNRGYAGKVIQDSLAIENKKRELNCLSRR